jgi:predicted nucleic acid-binding protein
VRSLGAACDRLAGTPDGVGLAAIDVAVAAGLAVVLDTNVLLSGLAYPASVPGRLLAAWRSGALAALRLGLAQTLVTGDKALLGLRDRYPIRTPAEFWTAHGGLWPSWA